MINNGERKQRSFYSQLWSLLSLFLNTNNSLFCFFVFFGCPLKKIKNTEARKFNCASVFNCLKCLLKALLSAHMASGELLK